MILAAIVRSIFDFKQSTRIKRYSLIKDKVSVEDTSFPHDKINEFDDEVLKEVVDTIESSFNKNDLNNFHINLKNLRLGDINSIRNGLNISGDYNTIDNVIYLRKDPYYRQILSHEMLHLASTRKKRKRPFVGFTQSSLFKPTIGYGLTEGYTEYLNVVKLNNEPDSVYLLEKTLSKCIEDIIGKDKMESLFLNSDLKGLYKELSNYYTNKEIDALLISIDNLNRYAYRDNNRECITNIKNRSYQRAIHIINKGLLNKYKRSYDDNDLNSYITNMTNIRDALGYLDDNGNKDFIEFIDWNINTVIEFYSDKESKRKTL